MCGSHSKFLIAVWLVFLFFAPVKPQTSDENPAPLNNFQQTQEDLCRQEPINGVRTYSFRLAPRATVDDGGAPAGKKSWKQKYFPFLTSPKVGFDDVATIEKNLGHPIPYGESKRSQQIRLNSRQKLVELQKQAEENWQSWLKQNPDADILETKKAENRIRFQGLAAAKLSYFDWREQGLNVGEVGFQGFNCNSCWAFGAVDALQISRRLNALRNPEIKVAEEPAPSVQQLVSCLLPEPKEYCDPNWHGKAFTFFMEKGMPLGGPTYYKAIESKTWHCDSEAYIKALTWDFVAADAKSIPANDEIKRALIQYGPIVSTMGISKCLWLYGDGVFNETREKETSHVILIIGWDDEKGAWLIKNSYGKNWGEKGFGWIKYGTYSIGQSSAWIIADPQEEARIAKEFGEKQK